MDDKELFLQIEEHLLQDKEPSQYIKSIINEENFNKEPFNIIKKLMDVEQNLRFHPEGNVFNHTLMVVDEAAKRREECHSKRNLMWAALLHDLGKVSTTKVRKGKITSYNHDKVGAEEARKFLMNFTEDEEFISSVSALVRWHMQSLFVRKDLPFKDLEALVREVYIKDIVLLTVSDRLGRGGLDEEKIKEELSQIEKFKKMLERII